MKIKGFFVAGMSCVLLTCAMASVEAGFNLHGVANKVINKTADSILSSTNKKQTNNKPAQNQTSKTQSVKPEIKPTAYAGQLDPLPPDKPEERPDWFDNRTNIYVMTNARLVAEYDSINKWRTYAKQKNLAWLEPDMCRHDELGAEIRDRIRAVERYANNVEEGWLDIAVHTAATDAYKRTVSSNISPLYKHGLELRNPGLLVNYHPEVD